MEADWRKTGKCADLRAQRDGEEYVRISQPEAWAASRDNGRLWFHLPDTYDALALRVSIWEHLWKSDVSSTKCTYFTAKWGKRKPKRILVIGFILWVENVCTYEPCFCAIIRKINLVLYKVQAFKKHIPCQGERTSLKGKNALSCELCLDSSSPSPRDYLVSHTVRTHFVNLSIAEPEEKQTPIL